jgi:hypothetical protein
MKAVAITRLMGVFRRRVGETWGEGTAQLLPANASLSTPAIRQQTAARHIIRAIFFAFVAAGICLRFRKVHPKMTALRL